MLRSSALVFPHFDLGVTKFTLGGGLHLSTQLLGHGLHAVANANTGTPALNTYSGARGLPASVVTTPDRPKG
ncbi:hypothetical protein ACLK12_13480 [Escherichia coli]